MEGEARVTCGLGGVTSKAALKMLTRPALSVTVRSAWPRTDPVGTLNSKITRELNQVTFDIAIEGSLASRVTPFPRPAPLTIRDVVWPVLTRKG